MEKTAQSVSNSGQVGAYLASVCRFALSRVPENQRRKATENLIGKLNALDYMDVARKRLPPMASVGQCITLVKSSMFGQRPDYIRAVLNSITAHLRY
jgi:hypothetical protein